MTTLLAPLNSVPLMHLGGSSLCQGYLTSNKHLKLTILDREWGRDQRHLGESVFLEKRHPEHCPSQWGPLSFCKAEFTVRCDTIDVLPVPSLHAAIGARPLSKGLPWELERGLDYLLKWHFQHLKHCQLGDLPSPWNHCFSSQWSLVTLP